MVKTDLDTLPEKPGIYKFLDMDRNLLYIGKAINLRNRVKSYFNNDLYDRPRIRQMLPFVYDVEIIETNNEIESLVLESVLIKKYQPKYNSDLKDDKSYSWIYISTKEEFPTVKIVRKIKNEEFKKGQLFGPYPSGYSVKRIFSYLRKIYPFCTCKKEQEKECLYFHLGLCPGPYHGHITKELYRKNINEIIKFLKGKKRGHISTLEKEMKLYSKNKEYEKAATIRDRIDDLQYLAEKIEFTRDDTEESYKERREKLLMDNFINLKIELNLNKLNRIECYDISNIQGKMAYGSMVVATNGQINHKEYRIFKIRGMETPNDPSMLKHVLERRFDEKNLEKYKEVPDIVLIDGGKSQLSVLKDYIPKNILILGISKGKRLKRKGGKLLDEFWCVNNDSIERIDILNSSLLIDLRDEAHRFAILHHRKARAKYGVYSELEKISGVGHKRRKLLIKAFIDINGIKKASLEDLGTVVKNKKVAEAIFRTLNT
ncbi:MAG: GIY-YIG nuclease family protein [Candidatus Dojkabacteria bacterium]